MLNTFGTYQIHLEHVKYIWNMSNTFHGRVSLCTNILASTNQHPATWAAGLFTCFVQVSLKELGLGINFEPIS